LKCSDQAAGTTEKTFPGRVRGRPGGAGDVGLTTFLFA